jgi:hypothetical protein
VQPDLRVVGLALDRVDAQAYRAGAGADGEGRAGQFAERNTRPWLNVTFNSVPSTSTDGNSAAAADRGNAPVSRTAVSQQRLSCTRSLFQPDTNGTAEMSFSAMSCASMKSLPPASRKARQGCHDDVPLGRAAVNSYRRWRDFCSASIWRLPKPLGRDGSRH